MNILLIKPSSLGDVVHALPVANLLRMHFPDATIAWLINDTLVGLLKNCPIINAIIPFYRQRWNSLGKIPEFLLYLRKLRAQQYDMTIDLQGLLRSGLVTKGAAAPRRIGLSDAREGSRWFYNDIVEIPSGVKHAADRYLQVIRHLGLPSEPVQFPFGESDEDRLAVDDFLEANGAGRAPLIGICPGARWDNKRWPAEFFADLTGELTQKWKPHRVVLIGGAAESEHLRHIAQASESSPVVMDGKLTLSQLVELLRRCTLFFGNDSGPTHIAAALEVPTVELFGPTDPALTGPHASQRNHTAVLHKPLPCSPCLKPTCKNDVHLECLKTISVRDVLVAAEELMDRSLTK